MTVNPEFRRNLWLEFSLQRLVAMPLVLAAVLWIDYLVRSAKGPEYGYLMMRISDDALVIYFALIVLWGSRVAACAVAQEIGDTTWDGQRMSAIGPWAMTWGKLFGSTAFVWYGGVLVLVVIAATSRQEMFVNDDGWIHLEPSLRWITTRIGTVLALGIICHASGLLASLLYIHGGAETRRINVTLFQLVGIAAFFAFFPLYLYGWQPVGDINVPKLHWYGRELVAVDEFIFVSTTIVAAWAVLGVYRMMRAELQMTGWPWLWSLFVLYFAVYLAGFSWFEFEAGVLRPVYASLFVFLCAYAVALCEPKDVAKVRRLIRDVASRQWSSAATTAPLWLVTYGLALGGAVVAVILLMAGDAPGSRGWLHSQLPGVGLSVSDARSGNSSSSASRETSAPRRPRGRGLLGCPLRGSPGVSQGGRSECCSASIPTDARRGTIDRDQPHSASGGGGAGVPRLPLARLSGRPCRAASAKLIAANCGARLRVNGEEERS